MQSLSFEFELSGKGLAGTLWLRHLWELISTRLWVVFGNLAW